MSGSAPPRRPAAPARSTARQSGAEAATRQRFAQRASSARRRPRRALLVAALGLLLAAVLAWVVAFSSLLDVESVEVSGADRLDVDAVTALAEGQRGTPLARVDTSRLQEQISAEVPGVQAVTVSRSWPSTLTVEVTSRVAALALAGEDRRYRLVSADGTSFRTVDAVPKGVPEVTSSDGGALSGRGVEAATQMLATLPPERRGQVRDIAVDAADHVSFDLDGTRVIWGDASSGERKRTVLEILLKARPKTVDVSAPDTPVTRD